MRNVSESCIENKNTHFVSSNLFFPPKAVPLMR